MPNKNILPTTNMNSNQNKVTSNLIICHRCNYKWTYKGNNPYYCCCPFCRTTIRIGKNIIINLVAWRAVIPKR